MKKAVVLIVDDAAANIQVLMNLLKADYAILAAKSGEKALALAAKKHPDLVLLDVMMPEMDGFEVCRRLKADPGTADIPVIFVSGDGGDVERGRGSEVGAADFLTKPIDPPRLFAAIEAVLA